MARQVLISFFESFLIEVSHRDELMSMSTVLQILCVVDTGI